MRLRFLAAALLAALPLTAAAEIRLPHVFSDHAVLQREKPIHLWGWSIGNEIVTAVLHGQTVTTTANAYGIWELYLRPEAAGGPYTLTVTGSASKTPVTLTDILVGDVWIASGQSNMEMPLAGFNDRMRVKNGTAEIAAANHPNIRLLLQTRTASPVQLYDQPSNWSVCTPEAAANFSAVAYFFGREISEREHVPIGLIDTTWGGTPAHAWISSEGIAYNNLTSIYTDGAAIVREESQKALYFDHYNELHAAGVPNAQSVTGSKLNSWVPSSLYNAMIAPYVGFTMKGVIWYQGETDSGPARAPFYARVFPSLITDWRRQWGEGDFPFLFVQLSSFGGNFAAVRDAQRRTLEIANTGMAVTLDVGTKDNVHPPDKQTVAGRLALLARGMVYGEALEAASPTFVQATIEGSAMRVWLSHADGLKAGDSGIGDFDLLDEKGVSVPADARLEKLGNAWTILVSAPNVKAPTAVRYGWAPFVTHYLYNSAGLPLGTFTSERLSPNVMVFNP